VYRQLVSSRSRYIFFEGNTGAYDYICCSQAGLVYHWQRTVFIISFTARTHAYPEATGKLEQPVAVTVVRIRPCNYMCVGSQYITQVSNIAQFTVSINNRYFYVEIAHLVNRQPGFQLGRDDKYTLFSLRKSGG